MIISSSSSVVEMHARALASKSHGGQKSYRQAGKPFHTWCHYEKLGGEYVRAAKWAATSASLSSLSLCLCLRDYVRIRFTQSAPSRLGARSSRRRKGDRK